MKFIFITTLFLASVCLVQARENEFENEREFEDDKRVFIQPVLPATPALPALPATPALPALPATPALPRVPNTVSLKNNNATVNTTRNSDDNSSSSSSASNLTVNFAVLLSWFLFV